MPNLETVRKLREAGQFRRALKTLGEISVSGEERLTVDVLRAELLERTGKYQQSRMLTEAAMRKSSLSRLDRSTCELVLARLNIEAGEVEKAAENLQHSIAIAGKCEDIERLCWAQLRLLLLLSDRSGPDSTITLLSELRAHVMKAGHPGIVAALHIHLAETEAKRGLLRNARRHLDAGKRGLAGSSNRWLEALAENVECAVEIMRSDFTAAHAHARRCLDFAEDAGAASVHESALGNLANLSLLAAQFDEAANYLNRANVARKGSDNWAACAETLARVALAQGRLDECMRLLDEIDNSITAPSDRSRYVYRHTQLTRVQLLARLGDLDGALRHVEFALTLATQSRDHLLNNLALLARAELLQEAERVSDCASLLRNLVLAIPSQAPDFFAQYERVLACGMARTGQIEAAEAHRRRAERVYIGLRHEAGQLELSRCWRSASGARLADGRSHHQAPINSAIAMIGDIASIMLHVGRPELIARELVDLLGTTECVRYASAFARGADGAIESLAHSGEPRDPTTSSDEQRLLVGTAREREIEILVDAKPDLESVATVNAVVLLLATLHDLERARAEREEHATLWPVDELPVGDDGAVTVGHMREMMSFAKRVANANVSVLITGESGTGKEIIARAIHAHSSRAQKPFIPFNCAALPRELLESQLFGHRRGAFTGADRDNPGLIRSARDGTLFLDEIGELGLDLQPKLLRFLESGEICPLGEPPFIVNVRIVAATNSNLETLVKDGRFREDLFYRLNVIRLTLKPLRDRRDEIPTLVGYFLMRAAEEFRKSHVRLAEETMERLALYAWPGNVRQLQNEIRRIVALAQPNSVLRPDVLSDDIFKSTSVPGTSGFAVKGRELAVPLTEKLNPTLSRIEREMIKGALRDHHGRVDAAAKALGISRKGLYLKRQRLGL